MPIIRKILNVGDSKAITIPKSWIASAEENAGKKIVALALEVDRIITLRPVFAKDEKKQKAQEPRAE
jgi:antitoxin component of MazEF toxin-antitoxin module